MTPPTPTPTPGDAVELLTELRSPSSGRVYEIGERARVVAADPGRVELVLVDGGSVETVSCRCTDVATARRRTTRPAAPWSARRAPSAA